MRLVTCHPDRKHKARGLCLACYSRVYKKEYGPRGNLLKRLRYAKDPRKAIEKSKIAILRWTYGLTPEAYEKLKQDQNGMCALCLRIPYRGLGVDHDHETGQVRGLLCIPCNTFLGKIDRDPSLLNRIVIYRERGKPRVA